MATREKQIEELGRFLCSDCANECKNTPCMAVLDQAEKLYNTGYRKVVLCDDCYLQGHCVVEDAFNTARMADSMKFCAVGKTQKWTEVRRNDRQ